MQLEPVQLHLLTAFDLLHASRQKLNEEFPTDGMRVEITHTVHQDIFIRTRVDYLSADATTNSRRLGQAAACAV